ncbi:MAG: adenylate/guanylate cyclase domain-containing protein [Desulfamplus sp.]|nr:adenylate/guanylate cyclase domain-containing protein [Desulfamplus sp.]
MPEKFLTILGIDDILDINSGDNVQADMSILFANIRDFAAHSENMTQEETFGFLNSHLKLMGTIIRQHNGFVDKYIGTKITALFEKSDDAVHAATEMLQKLVEYNEGKTGDGYRPVEIGIGIDTGTLRIGTVGEEGVIGRTVIGDAVNLASRIEGLTKQYGVSIIISNETRSSLTDSTKFELRQIDMLDLLNSRPSGKTEPVIVWEVFNCDTQDILSVRKNIEPVFQEARYLYGSGQFEEAYSLFLNCLAKTPMDKIIQLYSYLCREHMKFDVYERFVPRKFLKILGINDIVDIKLGENAEKNMAILFSDIRGFTSLSENMTPEENFKFLNSYLAVMGPIIRRNNGFVDKYIGDAIMALFETSDDALQAAIEMLQKLVEYNQGRKKSGYAPVKIGIGINTGTLRIGTIGESGRMEATVISDAVNLASRIEGMTKTYGVSLLISNDTYRSLTAPKKFELRKIDRVTAKGKSIPITIWEVFSSDPQNILKIKKSIEPIFQEARHLYQSRAFEEAHDLFLNCLARNPKDKTVQLYSDRCKLYMKLSFDDNMDEVVRHVTYSTISMPYLD